MPRAVGDTVAVIHLLDDCDERATRSAVLAGFEHHVRSAIAARGQGDGRQVERVETEVAADPTGTIRFDASGAATLEAPGSFVVPVSDYFPRFDPGSAGAELRAAAVARGGDLVRFDRSRAVFATD
jgi:hypothetical protein